MQNSLEALKNQALSNLCLVTGTEFARAAGFRGDIREFRDWCQSCGIQPVPGRSNYFDPKVVRHRLDELQGLLPVERTDNPISLVEQRRARRAA